MMGWVSENDCFLMSLYTRYEFEELLERARSADSVVATFLKAKCHFYGLGTTVCPSESVRIIRAWIQKSLRKHDESMTDCDDYIRTTLHTQWQDEVDDVLTPGDSLAFIEFYDSVPEESSLTADDLIAIRWMGRSPANGYRYRIPQSCVRPECDALHRRRKKEYGESPLRFYSTGNHDQKTPFYFLFVRDFLNHCVELGDPNGIFCLGELEISTDPLVAIRYFEQASQLGVSWATERLVEFYWYMGNSAKAHMVCLNALISRHMDNPFLKRLMGDLIREQPSSVRDEHAVLKWYVDADGEMLSTLGDICDFCAESTRLSADEKEKWYLAYAKSEFGLKALSEAARNEVQRCRAGLDVDSDKHVAELAQPGKI